MGLAGGVLFLIGYGLYTIIITLAPAGMGANAIMRKASEIVKHDPDVSRQRPLSRSLLPRGSSP